MTRTASGWLSTSMVPGPPAPRPPRSPIAREEIKHPVSVGVLPQAAFFGAPPAQRPCRKSGRCLRTGTCSPSDPSHARGYCRTGRPALPGPSPVVVRPGDFVDERVPAEDPVQQNLAVVDFPVIDVKEQRTARYRSRYASCNLGPRKSRQSEKTSGDFRLSSRVALFSALGIQCDHRLRPGSSSGVRV